MSTVDSTDATNATVATLDATGATTDMLTTTTEPYSTSETTHTVHETNASAVVTTVLPGTTHYTDMTSTLYDLQNTTNSETTFSDGGKTTSSIGSVISTIEQTTVNDIQQITTDVDVVNTSMYETESTISTTGTETTKDVTPSYSEIITTDTETTSDATTTSDTLSTALTVTNTETMSDVTTTSGTLSTDFTVTETETTSDVTTTSNTLSTDLTVSETEISTSKNLTTDVQTMTTQHVATDTDAMTTEDATTTDFETATTQPSTTNFETTTSEAETSTTLELTTETDELSTTEDAVAITTVEIQPITTKMAEQDVTTLGVVVTDSVSEETALVTTPSNEVSTKTGYKGQIVTEQEWDDNLNDKQSPEFQQLANQIRQFLLAILANSELAGLIDDIIILGFSPGSIVVKFYIGVINVVYDELSMKNKFNEAYNSVANPSYVIRSEDTSFTVEVITTSEMVLSTLPTTTVLIDRCLSSPCPVNSNCTNYPTEYVCVCHEGYYWENEDCLDTDECLDYVCQPYSICNNTVGSYTCTCRVGFYEEDKLCKDIDECLTPDTCPSNSTCINTVGSYKCPCHEGFVKDTQGLCQDIDECLDYACPAHAYCNNTIGSFTCTCQQGFYKDVNTNVCLDIDECQDPLVCPSHSTCINIDAGFHCICHLGYNMTSNNLCIDIDECLQNVCPQNSTCNNTEGSYVCPCDVGFTYNQGLCEDINECLSKPCPANSDCQNTKGRFLCPCRAGYQSVDSKCLDINECDYNPCPSYSNCTNNNGSYTCSCWTGYVNTGSECQDINECLYGVCPSNSICTNTDGSFNCDCIAGYQMVYGHCQDIDECLSSPCTDHAVCTNTIGSFTCQCVTGFTDVNGQCQDINECTTDPCPSHSNCTNTEGSYRCVCHDGFYQQDDYRCLDLKIFGIIMQIMKVNGSQAEYTPQLQDTESTEYLQLLSSLQSSFGSVMNSSTLIDTYIGVTIRSISPGSIIVDLYLYYNLTTNNTAIDLYTVIANNGEDFMDYGIEFSADNLTVQDINECVSSSWNDCSLKAYCINLEGRYNCSCSTGYLDISGDPSYPGRSCAVIDDINKDPISGLHLTCIKQFFKVTDNVLCSINLNRGSHVSYDIDYGDGTTTSVTDPVVLAFMSPTTFSHMYTMEGNFTITVQASNDISLSQTTKSVIVQKIISWFKLQMTQLDVLYPGSLRMDIISETNSYSNVHISMDYGDGEETFQYTSDIVMLNPVSENHYYDVGQYNIVVNISNYVSYQIIEDIFTIDEMVSGLSVTGNIYTAKPGENVILTIQTKNGSNLIFDVYFNQVKFQSLIIRNSVRGMTTYYLPASLSNVGIYNVSVVASNNISSETYLMADQIYIENEVKNMIVSTDAAIANPTGDIPLTITYLDPIDPPSHVDCNITLNNIFVDSVYFKQMQLGNSDQFSTKWDDTAFIGELKIELFCANKLSQTSFMTWTSLQQPISGIFIDYDIAYIPTGNSINFVFTIGSGSKVMHEISFGDGTVFTESLTLNSISNFTINKEHYFVQKGQYQVAFRVTNIVSQKHVEMSVWVLEAVEGLKIGRYFYLSDHSSDVSFGYGDDENIYPTERNIIFDASVVNGNNLIYAWNLGNGVTMETTEPTLSYQYTNDGNYQVVVTASNQLSSASRSFNITLYQTVLLSTLSNDGPTNAFETITFYLQLSQPGTESCYTWNLGDGSPIVIYGENNCQDVAIAMNYKYIYWKPVISLDHQHMYRKNSTFTVIVTGTNLISSKSILNLAIITGISCFYPIVHVIGGGQDIDEPVSIEKSKWITLESFAEINCKVSQNVNYDWNIYKINQGVTYQDYTFEAYPIDGSVIRNNFNLDFPPRTFESGHYRISLNVSMSDIYGLSAEDFTYLNITPTPLHVKIKGGNARVVGYNQILKMNAGDETYDPDIDKKTNKTGMVFQWKCRKSTENYGTTIPVIDIPELNVFFNITRQSGCFGTGIGILPLADPEFEISTLYLEPNSINIFELTVSKDARVTTFEQKVFVVEGDPPTLTISCHENCGSKMNPSSELTLSVSCLECSNYDKKDFTWSLYLKDDASAVFDLVNDLDPLTTTGTVSHAMSIKQKSLVGGRIYRMRVHGKVYGYAHTFTEYEFLTNLPPYGGSCSIDPTSGYALEEEFVISCTGWLNPGEESILGRGLLYRFWTRPQGALDTQLLYYGKDPFTPKSKFSLGPEEYDYSHDVIVRISNPIGEYVETYLKVKVNEPVVNDVANLLTMTSGGNNELSSLFSSGKAQEAKQLIVAVASLINYSPAEIGISRASLIQMITSINTPPSTSDATTDTTNGWLNETTTWQPTEGDSTINPGSTMDPAEKERLRKEEEAAEKQLRVELRTSVIKILSTETETQTLDSLQQTAMAFRVITHESTELSDESQDVAIGAMERMANSLQTMVESSRTESEGQKYSTAEDILACLGSVVFAATGEEIRNIAAQNLLESNGVEQTTEATGVAVTQAPMQTVSNATESTINAVTKKAKVKEIASKVLDVAEVVYQSVIKNQAPDEPPVILQSMLLTIIAQRSSVPQLNNSNVNAVSGSFKMPSSNILLSSVENSSYIDLKVLSSKINPYVWDPTAKFINSPVLTLDIYRDEGEVITVENLEDRIVIDIDVDSSALNTETFTLALDNSDTLYFHSFQVRSNDSTLTILIDPRKINRKLEVFVKFGDFPSITDYDWNTTIPHEVTEMVDNNDLYEEIANRVFLSHDYVRQNGGGLYYIGIRAEVNVSEIDVYEDYYDYELEEADVVNYTLSFVTSGCYYWNTIQDKWTSDNCSVSSLSNTNFTRCLCNHLTSFGVDFFVPPNEIDFQTVFDNLDQKLKDNWAVLSTLCGFIFLYILGLVWTRYQDKKDIIKWGVSPLIDNVIQENYCYQITVCTGMRRGAGTRSHVRFILAGDFKDTGVRQLEDDKQIKTLSRGSVNNYIMSVSEWLGPLTFIRVWHDSSGKGKNQGWYLSKVIVTDLQTGETFFFLCNKWFAVEEDDGMVDRLIPVSGASDLTSFQNLFVTKTKRSFSDSHLWISIFSRPQRSNFTRSQRLSCILSLIFTTMVANAMFYQAEEKVQNVESFKLGPLEFTLHGLYISVVSSLVVLPINILIDLIFRKSRPKETRITNAFVGNVKPVRTLSQIRLKPRLIKCDDMTIKEVSDYDFVTEGNNSENDHSETDYTEIEHQKTDYTEIEDRFQSERCDGHQKIITTVPAEGLQAKRKKKFKLPHWCVYVGWILVFLSSGVSCFFTFLYSMEWGKEKSINWLSSMILSIFESVTVIQPIKIILIAVLIAALLRKPDIEEETDFDPDISNKLKKDEELIHTEPKRVLRQPQHIEPPAPEEVAKAREIRLNEMKMHTVLREIIFYFLFLTLIILVASHSRDSRSFHVKDAIVKILTVDQNLTRIHKIDDIWKWIKKELLPNLYVLHHWNGDPLGVLGDRIVSTLTSYRVGPVRLRQQRVRPESCYIPFVIHTVLGDCSHDWSSSMEDEKTYDKGWVELTSGHSSAPVRNNPWSFRSFHDNDGVPFSGTYGIYPGGGYVADLIGQHGRATQIVNELEALNWIDRYSRGMFIEFSIYNPNVNTFSYTFISFEISTTGKIVPDFSLKTFRLFSYIGGYGIFVVSCEILTVIFIFYYFVRELRKIRKEGRKYFGSFWNLVEIINVCLAIVSIVMYIMRHAITNLALRNVKKLRDRFYNFQRLAMWDEIFGYILAFTIYIYIIKLLHMFRFNRRMSMLAGVIRYSAGELTSFSFALTIFILGYAIWGYLMFGPNLASYKSMMDAIETLISFALGKYDYRSLGESNRVFGPLFFFAFFFTVMFLLINIFVAILNESIAAIKKDVSKQSNEYEIVSFMWNRFITWTGIDFNRILQDIKLKYFLSDEDIKEIGESMDNFEDKLDDIFVRLDNLATLCSQSYDDEPPFGESSGMQAPVFSQLFGSSKKPLTFKQGDSIQHPVFKTQKWYAPAPSTSKC